MISLNPDPGQSRLEVAMPQIRLLVLVAMLCLAYFHPAAAAGPPSPEGVEAQLESILFSLERAGRTEAALEAYQQLEIEVLGHMPPPADPEYGAWQRVLAYVLLRQGNMLRQLGQADEAMRVAGRELEAARASQDPLTEARTEFSLATTLLASGERERGQAHLERARELFSAHEGADFRQGLGWYWIIRADLARAGLLSATPAEVIGFSETALHTLLPLDNWAGVARAYAALAHGLEGADDPAAAAGARALQARYDALANSAADPQPSGSAAATSAK